MPKVNYYNFHSMSNGDLYRLKESRWRCRYDLKFLCNEVLGYKDVNEEVHRALINTLQQFDAPTKEQFLLNDDLRSGYIKYTPVISLTDFVKREKWKRRLILDFRGSLKTTINATAHSLQWILNYPNIGILLIQSSIEKAEEILAGIKWHFQYNKIFRELFPEHVPQSKVHDWCTKGAMQTEAFDGNNLALGMPHREGTIITGGIDKGMAGKHLDVLKFSDIVDPTNTKNQNSCNETTKQYYLCENLLTSPIYWIDMEGTRYSFADTYGQIIKHEAKLSENMKVWKIYSRGCYKKKTEDGEPEKFIPKELFLPDLVDESLISEKNPLGKVSWWPDRYPVEVLENKRLAAPYEFATQMYNNPQSAEDGMVPFPITEKLPVWVKREDFNTKYPISHYEFSIDTAETNNQKSNYSSIAVGAWTGSGNCVIVEIIHGKFLPDLLIDKIYEANSKYSPLSIKIEETSFTRGLMAGIRRIGENMGVYLPISLIKRDNQIAKQERIINTLQPYYFSGQLRFLDDLEVKDLLLEELREFPTGTNDDIIDSITDLFQNKEYFGAEFVKEDYIRMSKETLEARMKSDQEKANLRALKLQSEYRQMLPKMTETWLGIGTDSGIPGFNPNDSYNRTGGL